MASVRPWKAPCVVTISNAPPDGAGPTCGELDGTLVGLRPGVAEEDGIEPARAGEKARQPGHRLVVVGGAAIDQSLGLRLEGLEHDGMAVAEAVDGPALDEIQVLAPLAVAEPRAGALHHDDRRPMVIFIT